MSSIKIYALQKAMLCSYFALVIKNLERKFSKFLNATTEKNFPIFASSVDIQ